MKKRLLLAAIALSLVICSCGEKEKNKINDDIKYLNPPIAESQTDDKDAGESAEEKDVVTEDDTKPAKQELLYINPLTGTKTQENLENVRPVAIMVNELYESLPQIGVAKADIVYETLEEGGITRLLCIYNDYADIAEIGSVRSARDYYIDIADAHDAVYVHAGGSTYAYDELRSRKTNDLDEIYMSGYFYRSAERRKTMAREHTLMISGKGLVEGIANKGYRATSQKPCPLTFTDYYKYGGVVANHIEIPFSIGYIKKPYATSFFDYDKDKNVYLKGHFGEKHIDGATGEQLSFTNVITLTCSMNRIANDPLGCIQVHFTGSGKGTYSVSGTMREIVWKKADRQSAYTLYESDGQTPLELARGKSYIAVVPAGTNVKTN